LEDNVVIRLEDGITLNTMNRNKMKIKKFFHVPNFEIYIIKEIPFNTKFYFSHFKEKLAIWNKKLANSNKFLKIYNEYLNNPEG
jgi:hypothetical protein